MRRPASTTTVCCVVALVAAVAPSRAAKPDVELAKMALAADQRSPLIRIGLDSGHRILVSSDRPFRIVDPADGSTVWRERYDGEVAVVAAGGPKDEIPSVFRVQTGAFRNEQAAQAEKQRLERRFGAPVVVRHDPDRENWRVRVGAAAERLALQPLMSRLREAGLRDLWIAEEPAQDVTGITLRLVDESYDSAPTERQRLAVVPQKGARIEVEGTSYRGVVELRVSSFGTVRAINWVGLEQYLLGVVPAELGPEVWPQLGALRAQAVAARTYAWRHRGQFEGDGYDLCATPRCQAYGGADAEHPLSDRAVWSTRGQILTWKGNPINAYYTATCGGHTEDVAAIFPGEEAPYLRGVACRAEGDALESLRATLVGRAVTPVFDETGHDVTRDWALLAVAGVANGAAPAPRRGDPLAPGTLRAWTAALASLAGLPRPAGEAPAIDTLGAAAALLLEDLGWTERAGVLLSEADLPALLRDDATRAQPAAHRRALAYLVSVEGLRPFPDGTFRATQPPTVARLLPALVRVGEAYEAFGLRSGVVARVGATHVTVIQGKGETKLRLAEQPVLFKWSGGRSVPATSLEMWPGDRVRFRVSARGQVDFLELIPPVKGVADDRSSVLHSWEVRKTRHALERAINRRVSIGRLRDLRVVRRGVSGRVVELEVVGTEASTVIRGFDVRRLLDLRESLVVVEPQRDAEGRIEAVVFAGKGWGHGVGLCQVGAYGMAVRGAGYREILSHYYPGARLGPLPGR